MDSLGLEMAIEEEYDNDDDTSEEEEDDDGAIGHGHCHGHCHGLDQQGQRVRPAKRGSIKRGRRGIGRRHATFGLRWRNERS